MHLMTEGLDGRKISSQEDVDDIITRIETDLADINRQLRDLEDRKRNAEDSLSLMRMTKITVLEDGRKEIHVKYDPDKTVA